MSTQTYLAELFSLEGRVAVVTGGSSGIGRAITGALAGPARASSWWPAGRPSCGRPWTS
ncbi:hypothetical protein SBADM41S_08230 [Streptomyces badius]